MNKDKPINARISTALYARIKQKATRLGMSFSDAVRVALTKWIEGK